jgi:hypothetical protein
MHDEDEGIAEALRCDAEFESVTLHVVRRTRPTDRKPSKLMRLVLHPKVYSDIDKIMGYYERVATSEGSERNFTPELRYFVTKAADKSQSVSIRERDIIDIHLLDPDVDRCTAEYEECRLEWSWILIGTSAGGGRDSESVQAS